MRVLVLAFLSLLLSPGSVRAEITLSPGRDALVVSGWIGPLDPCTAAEILTHHPGVTTVIVNSPGGDAWAGVQLARLFGHAGLTAMVPPGGRALSAAGIAALGAPRLVLTGRLGLHAPYNVIPGAPLASAMVAETRDEMRTVLEEAGLTARQIDAVLTTPPRTLLMLPPAALTARPRPITVNRPEILRLHTACTALTDLHGRHAPDPT